jgi:hypothetical protein
MFPDYTIFDGCSILLLYARVKSSHVGAPRPQREVERHLASRESEPWDCFTSSSTKAS